MSPAGHSHRLGSSDVGATYRSDGGPCGHSGSRRRPGGPHGGVPAGLARRPGRGLRSRPGRRRARAHLQQDGYRFDLGGHRFFTKIEPVQRLWEEMLGDDFLTRPRLSRIYYRGGFLAYPLRAADVVSRLGVLEALLCTASYLRARLGRKRTPETFEDWVTSRFGRRLYDASSATAAPWRRSATISPASRTSSRVAATGCTATTRITRCGPRRSLCSTSSTVRSTTSGR